MNHDSYSDDNIADILGSARVFAFVGASANVSRPSYFAMKYLIGKGYRVIPVNPGAAGQKILGQEVYATPGRRAGSGRCRRYLPHLRRGARDHARGDRASRTSSG